MKSIGSFIGIGFVALSLWQCTLNQYPPEIRAVTPSQATINQPVTIIGVQFGKNPAVLFGDSGRFTPGTITATADDRLTVTVPRVAVRPTQLRVSNDQGSTDPVAFTVLQPTPSLRAVEPTNGLPGSVISITGDFLDQLASIRFGTVQATDIKPVSAQQVQVTVPASLSLGPLTLSVETSAGVQRADFLVAGTPKITAISPRRGRAGGPLLVQGQNLTNGVVRINGQPTSPGQTTITDSEIRTVVPNTATPGLVSVTTFDRLIALSTDSLLLVSAPAVSAINILEGIKGDRVVLTGSGFRDVTSVTFGGTPATFRLLNDAQIETTVPDRNQAGDIFVTVDGPGGPANSPQPFLIYQIPSAIQFTPTRRAKGGEITVSGQSFYRITEVRINGKLGTFTGQPDGKQVPIQMPGDATTGTITVTNRAGTATSTQSITVVQKPVITSVTARARLGDRVTVRGNFLLNAQFIFTGGAGPANVEQASDSECVIVVPADAQTGTVRVTNETGESTLTDIITILRPVTNADFSPKSGKVGTDIVITGQNLSDVTEIRFSAGVSTPAKFVRAANSLTITATVPADAQTGTVCLANGSGIVCTTAVFTVVK